MTWSGLGRWGPQQGPLIFTPKHYGLEWTQIRLLGGPTCITFKGCSDLLLNYPFNPCKDESRLDVHASQQSQPLNQGLISYWKWGGYPGIPPPQFLCSNNVHNLLWPKFLQLHPAQPSLVPRWLFLWLVSVDLPDMLHLTWGIPRHFTSSVLHAWFAYDHLSQIFCETKGSALVYHDCKTSSWLFTPEVRGHFHGIRSTE